MSVSTPRAELRGEASPIGPPTGDSRAESLRLLQVAFACHPDESMETRIGWRRALQAAQRHQVTVLHGHPDHDALLAARAAEQGMAERVRFVSVPHGPLGRRLSRSATTYYAGYRLWHARALEVARSLHAKTPFDLVHQTTFCGFREPGSCRRLGVPFVWGPVGGTQGFPLAYLNQLGLREAWIEVCRNAINAWQLRVCPRVGGAVRGSAVLLAATEQAANDLQRATGRVVPVQLETGLDGPVAPPRDRRAKGDPLRILWAGRLRAWKTLPLLLRALPALPADVDWRLRVLGIGRCKGAWRRLADRLGVNDRIEWLGWPDYRDTLPHYRWADAFAFTSMRDTSGTGLLEALAAGTPIVGVDHQGAADIMTPNCALPVPVGRPRETIDGIVAALTSLSRDADLWNRLSEGARHRAEEFAWERQDAAVLDWYSRAMSNAKAGDATCPRIAPNRTPPALTRRASAR